MKRLLILSLFFLTGCTFQPNLGIGIERTFFSATSTDALGNSIGDAVKTKAGYRIFLDTNATFTESIVFDNYLDCNLDTDPSGLLVCGSDASGLGNVATSTADVIGQLTRFTSTGATPATIGGDAGLTYDASLDILDIRGGVSTTNATTTGWLNIGSTDVVASLGSLIGSGDIFAADDATVTGQFFTGSVRTGIINDFYDAACAVTNQFVTDVSDSGTFTCTALDTSGTWSGNAATASALAGCTDCISTPEIADVYLLNNGDNGTGLFTFSDLRPSVLNATSANIGTLTMFGNITVPDNSAIDVFSITGNTSFSILNSDPAFKANLIVEGNLTVQNVTSTNQTILGNSTTTGWFNIGTTDVVEPAGGRRVPQ